MREKSFHNRQKKSFTVIFKDHHQYIYCKQKFVYYLSTDLILWCRIRALGPDAKCFMFFVISISPVAELMTSTLISALWQAMLFMHGVTTGSLPLGIWEARAAEGSERSCGSTMAVYGLHGQAGWGWAADRTVWSYSHSSCQEGAVWEKAQKLRKAAKFEICGVNIILKFL